MNPVNQKCIFSVLALCIYQTILELSEYSSIYNPEFQLS